jgi:4-hydroxy-tetrahydrodipicolinate synthase
MWLAMRRIAIRLLISTRQKIMPAWNALHFNPGKPGKKMSMDKESIRERLRSVQLVPLTAFDRAGRLALQPMEAQTRRLFAAGIRVFIPCAGSSEFHTMSATEIEAVVAMTKSVVGDEATVIVPVGLQLQHALDTGRRALAAGASATLVMPLANPYLSDAGARDYYTQLMDTLGCPTIVYKKAPIPSDDLLLKLADHPHLVGVKYSINDTSNVQHVIAEDNGRIDWFCGNAERYAPYFFLAGATGYTSGAGNICPRLTLAMFHALAAGDFPEAMRLQAIINPIEHYRARDDSSYNVSFLKHAITHLGLDFGQPRPPYRRLTAEERHEIDALLPPILAAEEAMASLAAV